MNSILYAERKDKHKITLLRLKAEAQVWMEAPRLMETKTPEESSEFGHCILARKQQNKKKNSTTREGL